LVHASYDLRTRQQTSLTPRLQQSVKLLQMSALEFTQEVQQALSTNPFLEEGDEEEPSDDPGEDRIDGIDLADRYRNDDGPGPSVDSASDESASAENYTDLPEVQTADSYSGDYPSPRAAGDGDSDVGQWAKSTLGMHDHLSRDLMSYRLSPRDRLLAEYIIEALDDDGYLRIPLEELAGEASFSEPVALSEWETSLKLVQQLDAPGLAARSLEECLCLQLNAMPESTPGKALALRVVKAELHRLARHDYSGLERSLNCSSECMREACNLIQHLDPKPGRRYTRDDTAFVIPDVIVHKTQNRWVVTANRGAMPRARLHGTYPALFRSCRTDDRAPMAQELQEARWLIRNIEQRYATIQRVAEAIVERQQTFFEYGAIALRPLMLREIADELSIHESTVSRATGNKYMETPRGLFEFKHFFSRELATETGGTCSASAVRALIKEMIESENPHEPLSDVDLARLLSEQGVVVARRTVSKYRGQLKAPPAELRRAY
jgi:RNA polymerase sigma-54 factor